jgi:GST-like protein
MTWPWIRAAVDELGLALDATPHLARWHGAVAARPAVQRGIAVPVPGTRAA